MAAGDASRAARDKANLREATKVFPEGTAAGDLIREQVPTDYNPPTPAPPAPPPPPGP